MKTINLDRYLPELLNLYSFYRYSEEAFADPELTEKIKKSEFQSMYVTVAPFLFDSPVPERELPGRINKVVREKVEKEIENGLVTLRRQLLEAAFSIFERFLCHLLRVYFQNFPDILKTFDKNISFRTVIEIKENEAIFAYIIEKEVSDFSRRSLQEKKDYLQKHLKMTHQDEIWIYEGEELWKDIDRKRQAIVHHEESPDISHQYLLHAISYFQRIMLSTAMYAQADQGVTYNWASMENYTKRKTPPSLR